MPTLKSILPIVIGTNAAISGAAKAAGLTAIDLADVIKKNPDGSPLDPMELSRSGRESLRAQVNRGARLTLVSTDIPADAELRVKLLVALRAERLDIDVKELPFEDGANLANQLRAAIDEPPAAIGRLAALASPVVEEGDPFPLRCLPEPARGIVEGVASGLNCDPSGPALAALVTASAAIGATVRVKIVDGWAPPVSLYGLLLGYSGSRKSAMFRTFVAPFKKLHKQRLAEYRDQMATFEIQEEAYARAKSRASKQGSPETLSRPERPVLRQCYAEDVTVPSICRILANNRRGVLVFRDELAAWLQSFEQFKDRGAADVQQWINLFNGDSLTINRKTNDEHLFTENPFACVLGGIQPPILKRLLKPEHSESGLLHRVLMVRPARRKKRWQETGIPEEVVRGWAEIIEHLCDVTFALDSDGNEVPAYLPFSPKARPIMVAFEERLYAAQEELDEADGRIAYLARQEEIMPRLAGLLHLLETIGSGQRVGPGISVANAEAAVELVEWLMRERGRIESELAVTDEEFADRRLIAFLRTGPKTHREFGQFRKNLRGNKGEIELLVAPLVAAGLGQWADSKNAKGVPIRVFTLVKTGKSPHLPHFEP